MTRTTRRRFIRQLLLVDELRNAAPSGRTLVCLFLRGGADTLNMIIPYGDDRYYTLRPTISIRAPSPAVDSAASSLKINDFYSFHPKLRPLLPAFFEGRLGVVQGVGTDNPTGSHFEAQDQMEHGEAFGERNAGGWLGRFLRTRRGGDITPLSAVAIGTTTPESLRGAPSSSSMTSLDDVQLKTSSGDPWATTTALATLYGADDGLLRDPGRTTIDLLRRVDALRGRAYASEGGAIYPDDELGGALKEIARLIKANVGLEIACLDLDGWDTHFIQGSVDGLQASLISRFARALAAFDTDLKGYRDRVTILTMTEFGRRVYENGSLGTDHGRGFAVLAMGNRVEGGRVHGQWPGLDEEASPDANRLSIPGPSGLKILVDYRSILSEMLTAIFGFTDLSKVFPGFIPQRTGLIG